MMPNQKICAIDLHLILIIAVVCLIRSIDCLTCNESSSVLECFFCSNTSPNKKCSDENGNPTTSQWSILKSTPGQPTTNVR